MDMLLSRILITVGSGVSIGFGIWHFFVPRIWNWYSYIDASATELILAVRALNLLFSLSLVLFGPSHMGRTMTDIPPLSCSVQPASCGLQGL